MNILKKLLIICVYCILFQGNYGRKLHSKPYHGSSYSLDESKLVEKKVHYPKSNVIDRTSLLFKVNSEVPKEFHQKLTLNEIKDHGASKLETSTYKTLEMKVGEHLIRVKSEKESKNLGSEPKGGGYDISINPKFSHMIEIIHKGNLEKESKLSQSYDTNEEADEEGPEEFEADEEGPEEFEADEGDPDEFVEADEGDPDEFVEVDGDPDEFEKNDEGDPDEFVEADGEPDEFKETDEGDPDDFAETDGDPDEFEETDGDPDEFEETEEDAEVLPDHIKNTTEFFEEAMKTENNRPSKEQFVDNDESAFNEEFEGSGEELFADSDRNTTKTGRILGLFSRQNSSFPNCTTPKGEAGHCRRLSECFLSEALNNFNGFLQQLCLIRGVLVGICCPDNPVIETVNPDENSTTELTPKEINQPPEGCGLNTKTRIVGGTISVPHEWTWMVALLRRNRFYCGGVIINNWYILTAAHCVMGMNVKDLTVRLGEYDFNEQSKHTEDLSVSEIKRHSQFVTLTFQHDIALLKLKQSIKYSKFVGSICLPDEKARDYSNAKGTVVGWGTVSFGGAASPVLRQVTVPVWKNEDCDRTYLLERIDKSFMCAGSPENGEDACQGDSGGPLMTVSENGRWEVIGLVSWGRRCGDPTYPGVYTRVTTYLDWIKQNAV